MPTYEFRCPDGHVFDRFYRKISDGQSEVACPECGKIATRQMSAGAGLLFKGSGFYLTDYGKNAHRSSNGGGAESSKASEGGSSPESKSESKPSETKASDSKPSEPKSSDSKPASTGSTTSSSSGTKPDK
jgi:putative FmdB family regulatory protein